MSEPSEKPKRPADPVGRVLYAIAKWLAVSGGLVLCAMALVTTASVVGRAAFDAPILGDFEIVAIGTGVAIFAFLPWCQLTRGNVLVDFFMAPAPVRVRAFLDALGGLIYLAVAALLTWRMGFGGYDMYRYNELSMTISFPRWTTFPVSVLFLAFLVAVIVYTTARSAREMRDGEEPGP